MLSSEPITFIAVHVTAMCSYLSRGCTSDYDIGHAPTQRLCCSYDSTINHIQLWSEKECEQLETLAAVELYQSLGLCSAGFSHLGLDYWSDQSRDLITLPWPLGN